VPLVGLADRLGARVILEVIVAVGQAQPALVRLRDLAGRILEILVGLEAEEGAHSHALQVGHFARQLRLALQRGDARQLQPDGLGSLGLHPLLVHAGGVEVAHLLVDGVALGVVRRGLLQDLVQHRAVVFRQQAEGAPHHLVGGDGIVLDPLAAGVPVEVHTGVHALVHRIGVEAGQGLGGFVRGGAALGHRQRRGQQHQADRFQ